MTRPYHSISITMLALLLGACVSSTAQVPPAQSGAGTIPSSASKPAPKSTARVPATIPPPPPPPSFESPTVMDLPGLEGVIGETAQQLVRSFGQPRLDVREGDARKLQFAGTPCVLDIYLYPTRPGITPTATHLEARRASDGFEVDRVACANALKGR